MTPQELKNSILQLAIQGKLVEQRPEEGTAEELRAELLKEKKRLIQSGTLKGRKNKPLLPIDITPFDVPKSWRWVHLGDVAEIFGRIGFRGYTKNDLVAEGEGAITISPSNIDSAGNVIFDDCTYISWEKYEESPEIMVYNGDMILVKTGSSYGKCGIIHNMSEKATINPQLVVLKYITCDLKYLNFVLKSPMARNQYESFVIGTSIPTFSQEKLANLFFPLPPLAEQKRIVAKIEELLPLVDRYEEAWKKLEAFNKHFPDDMQKSLLQMAIQGKLVEQRPEEGTGEELYKQIQVEKQKLIKEGKIKKEKSLPEITDDEKPFDIPENWGWARIGAITYNFGQKTPESRFCYVDVGSINNKEHRLNKSEMVVEPSESSSRARKIVSLGDVIFATIRPYLQNICIIDREFSHEPIVSTAFVVMSCPKGLLNKYLFYVLLSPTFMEYANSTDKAKGVAYPAIGEKDFVNGIIPLPPLAEQKRIVAKLEELLPLCERLK